MKPEIHPDYVECTVRCSCGNTFTTRSTKPELVVELCNACHPFFTGQQKFVDAGGRVQRFADKFGGAAELVQKRNEEAKAAKQAKAEKEAEEAAQARAEKKAAKEERAKKYAEKAAKEAEKNAKLAAEAQEEQDKEAADKADDAAEEAADEQEDAKAEDKEEKTEEQTFSKSAFSKLGLDRRAFCKPAFKKELQLKEFLRILKHFSILERRPMKGGAFFID